MWGNKLGWAISVALVVAMAAAVAGAYVITSKRTPPTAFVRDGAHLGSIDLPINPKTLMMPQSRDEDAGIIYRRAINYYTSNQSMYAQLAKRFDVEKAELLIGVSSVLQAADYQKADIFPENQIDQVVSYNEKKQIAALQSVGGMCINIGIDYAKKK